MFSLSGNRDGFRLILPDEFIPDEIQEKYKDKNILLVTHGGTCRAINAYFNGIGENGHVQSAHIKNCEIREFEYKQKIE